MLSREELLRMFESAGAIRHGHFELSSGMHSGMYVQCALVLQYPRFAEKLGHALAALFSDAIIGAVVSPALGRRDHRPGSCPRTAGTKGRRWQGSAGHFRRARRQRHDDSRRGFSLQPDEHVLVVEDVWTTGGSTLETIRVVEEAGGRVVAAGALIDRSGGTLELGVETQALLDLPIAKYEPEDCPLCREGGVAVKPGSRFVRSAP